MAAYVSMQDPRLLSGYLDPLWDLRVNQGAYYESGVSHAGRDGRGDCCRRSRWREMDGVGNSHAAAQLTARPAGSAP